MKALVIARLTFQESIRRRALLFAILLTTGFLVLFGIGSYYAIRDVTDNARMTPDLKTLAVGEMLLAGLYGITNIGSLLAIFFAAGSIAPEIEEGTLHAIVPRPLRRWEIIVGKWLGFAAMLVIYVSVTSLAACLIIWGLSGYLSGATIPGVLLIAFKSLVLLSVALTLSTRLPALTSGIVAFILYAVSNVGGMVEQLGVLVRNQTMMDIGVITSLLVPSDSVWKMAASILEPPLSDQILQTLRGVGPFSVLAPPTIWMMLYAVVYTVGFVGLGIWAFAKRDL